MMRALLSTVIFKKYALHKNIPAIFPARMLRMSIISLSHSRIPYNSKRGHPLPKNLWGTPSFVPSSTGELFLHRAGRDAAREVFLEHVKMMSIGKAATVAPAIL